MSRPHVTVNLACSIDGKLSRAPGDAQPLGSRHDIQHLDHVRWPADAVLIGAGTLRAGAYPLQLRQPLARRLRAARGLPPGLGCIVVTRSLQLPWTAGFFHQPLAPFVAVACGASAAAAAPPLPAGTALWPCGEQELCWTALFEALQAHQVKRLVVEGGGQVVGQLLAAGLVDELCVTLCPRLIGGAAPGLTGGAPWPLPGSLRLHSCVRRGDELYCRYRLSLPSPAPAQRRPAAAASPPAG